MAIGMLVTIGSLAGSVAVAAHLFLVNRKGSSLFLVLRLQ